MILSSSSTHSCTGASTMHLARLSPIYLSAGHRRLVIKDEISPETSWILITITQKIDCSKTSGFVTFLIIDLGRKDIYAHSYLYFRLDLFHIQRWRVVLFQRSLELAPVAIPSLPPFQSNTEVSQSLKIARSANSSEQFLKVCHYMHKRTIFQTMLVLCRL